MANTVQVKRSGTANSTPSALEYGELALNYADGKVFWKNASNTISSFTFQAYATAASPAITGNVTIDTSSGVPLTITNTGTGASFRVNDEASDTTPFIIDASGNVGVGTATPSQKLTVVGGRITVNGNGTDGVIEISNGTVTHYLFTTSAALYIRTDGRNCLLADNGGSVGIGTASPTALLDVNSNTLRLRSSRTPASATATGNAGDICWDASYLYICTATNTWRRIAHATW